MRDMRDPQKLGNQYLEVRQQGVSIDIATRLVVDPYTDGGHISSNPAEHHSKTPQTLGNLDDGGAS